MRIAFISILLLGYGQTFRLKEKNRFTSEYREAFAESDRVSTAHLLMRQVIDEFELSELAPSLPFSLLMGTTVISDGNGDFFSTLSSAGAIRESFTAEELDLNVVYLRHMERELPNVDLAEYGLQSDHVFDITERRQFDQSKFDRFVIDELSQTTRSYNNMPPAAKAFIEADAVLKTPITILGITNTMNQIQTKLGKHPVSMYVTQYGGLEHHKGGATLALNELGIDPTWATRGIHVLDPEKIPSDVSDFDREELSQVWEMLDCDADSTKAYFGYKAKSTYYELVAFSSKAERVVIFNTAIPRNFDRLAAGFKTIKIYSMTRLMEARTGTGEGELILVRLETVGHSDFLRLMKRSEPLVACTGDMSLSEAISLDKLPFYFVPEHNELFWKNFRRMVQFYFRDESHPLNLYLASLGRHAKAAAFQYFMNPAVMEEIVLAWTVITNVIKRDFNSKTHLKVVVKELAARAKWGPQLIKFQNYLAAEFAKYPRIKRSTLKREFKKFLKPRRTFRNGFFKFP